MRKHAVFVFWVPAPAKYWREDPIVEATYGRRKSTRALPRPRRTRSRRRTRQKCCWSNRLRSNDLTRRHSRSTCTPSHHARLHECSSDDRLRSHCGEGSGWLGPVDRASNHACRILSEPRRRHNLD